MHGDTRTSIGPGPEDEWLVAKHTCRKEVQLIMSFAPHAKLEKRPSVKLWLAANDIRKALCELLIMGAR